MNTWRTTPGSLRHCVFIRKRGANRALSSNRNHAPNRCPALRSWRRAGPFPDACASSTRPSARMCHEGGAAAQFAFALGRLARERLLVAALKRATRPSFHGHSAQAGRLGEQMVAPRSISACAKSPARRAGNKRRRQPLDRRLRRRQFVLDRKQPRHHALDIAVHWHRRRVERDRSHRRRGVVADAGQRAQALRCSSGNSPPWRSTTARAQACRLRARA